MYKMETQNTVNLLNDTDGKSSKFTAKKWNVINDQNNTKYREGKSSNLILVIYNRIYNGYKH